MSNHLIFVYGTLKRGGPNNHLLDMSRFVGEFTTQPHYRLYTYYSLPCLVSYEGGHYHQGRCIKGEVYEVDENLLEFLDHFEGVLYERRPIKLGGIEGVEAYFYKKEIRKGEHFDCGSEFIMQKGERA